MCDILSCVISFSLRWEGGLDVSEFSSIAKMFRNCFEQVIEYEKPWTVYTIKGILFHISELLFWWVNVHIFIKLGYHVAWKSIKYFFFPFGGLENLNFVEDNINNSKWFYKWGTIINKKHKLESGIFFNILEQKLMIESD